MNKWLCLGCQRGKPEKCWGKWVDHTDGTQWICPNEFDRIVSEQIKKHQVALDMLKDHDANG
jgi:hypothetical protein